MTGNIHRAKGSAVLVTELDSPQLLIDLAALDANLAHMQEACIRRRVNLRVHFKSLKCGGLAQYLAGKGIQAFCAAKINEAEVLAAAGPTDIMIANQVVGPAKLQRVAELAKRVKLAVCVDEGGNVDALAAAARSAGSSVGVFVEIDVGMNRCGVEPGEPALELARRIVALPHLEFRGLQGYDGHLQLIPDAAERRRKCLYGLAALMMTRKRILDAGIAVPVVTGGGTGTWEFVADFPGVTEVQPGSFLLMDAIYNTVRPEFGCSLSVLATVISRRASWYVLDAGSKAISQDFGKPAIKNHDEETVLKLAEEHTVVECHRPASVGEQREVLPAHCCATMNLHRACVAHRGGVVEAHWPIECSGRYD